MILSNSLAETQKTVDPELIVPQATRVYLQKRGMNQVVSDYFESQRKHIPFTNAILAEQAISNFKVRGNRTLWAGRPGKFKVNVEGLGLQTVYCTEGLRWQFKREMQHEGKWTIEKIIALAKMFFTGEDVPKTALLLAGKNLLEQIQGVDYRANPEQSRVAGDELPHGVRRHRDKARAYAGPSWLEQFGRPDRREPPGALCVQLRA